MLKLTDLTNQTVWVTPSAVHAVVLPSLLTPGPSHCTVVVTGAMVHVSREEAERLLAELGEVLRAGDLLAFTPKSLIA